MIPPTCSSLRLIESLVMYVNNSLLLLLERPQPSLSRRKLTTITEFEIWGAIFFPGAYESTPGLGWLEMTGQRMEGCCTAFIHAQYPCCPSTYADLTQAMIQLNYDSNIISNIQLFVKLRLKIKEFWWNTRLSGRREWHGKRTSYASLSWDLLKPKLYKNESSDGPEWYLASWVKPRLPRPREGVDWWHMSRPQPGFTIPVSCTHCIVYDLFIYFNPIPYNRVLC